MALWLVRAGKYGEREMTALENSVIVIGWDELPDLSEFNTKEEIENWIKKVHPNEKPNTIPNWARQVWSFKERIQINDLVVLPLKSRSSIVIGRVKGKYVYKSDFPEGSKHQRSVEWLKELLRNAFEQDLLYSFGAFLAVCQIQRNNAEERIMNMIKDNGLKTKKEGGEEQPEESTLDIEEYAKDQIRDYISRKFRGHELSRLVEQILKTQGYYTFCSPPGADGGVDIIAGKGPMDFDTPHLCVQVKSSDNPVDVNILRELQGSMKNFGAQQGLLVSWGGFKSSVLNEARRLFFEVRLWDSGDVINALLENYKKIPEDFQAEIPLKQIWVVVPEEI